MATNPVSERTRQAAVPVERAGVRVDSAGLLPRRACGDVRAAPPARAHAVRLARERRAAQRHPEPAGHANRGTTRHLVPAGPPSALPLSLASGPGLELRKRAPRRLRRGTSPAPATRPLAGARAPRWRRPQPGEAAASLDRAVMRFHGWWSRAST